MNLAYATILLLLGLFFFLSPGPTPNVPGYSLYLPNKKSKIFGIILIISATLFFFGEKYHYSTDFVLWILGLVSIWYIFATVPVSKLSGSDKASVYKNSLFSSRLKTQKQWVKIAVAIASFLILAVLINPIVFVLKLLISGSRFLLNSF